MIAVTRTPAQRFLALLLLVLLVAVSVPFGASAAPKHLELNKKKVRLALGGAPFRIRLNESKPLPLTYRSLNEQVVKVDANGLVTPVAVGSTQVVVTAENGRKGIVKVRVVFVHVKKIALKASGASTRVGNTYTPKVTVSPSNASDKTLVWSSSNPGVASVGPDGTVTGRSPGECTVTARSASDANVTASLSVKVRPQAVPGKPLLGITVGVNAGHQRYGDYRKDPIYPGAKKKRYKVGVGTSGRWSHKAEYEINLRVALKLRAALEKEGATVVMIRETNNVNISNVKRSRIMNEAGCDIALNLHCNSVAGNSKANGLRLYTVSVGKTKAESYAIAKVLAPAYCESTGAKNGGITRSRGYISLNYSTVPAILVEMGYMSNKHDDLLLATDEYQQKIADGITEGLCRYFN